jgi:hypothetical protein
LGSFYGEAAKLVKCENNDLLVPANAEIVLEGEVMTSEGWVHDEGPYGEFTGMYGGGLKHNPRVVITCMTYRKNKCDDFDYRTFVKSHGGVGRASTRKFWIELPLMCIVRVQMASFAELRIAM